MTCSHSEDNQDSIVPNIPGVMRMRGDFRKMLDEMGIEYHEIKPELIDMKDNARIPLTELRGLNFIKRYLLNKEGEEKC